MMETITDIFKSLGYGLLAIALCRLARQFYAVNPARGKLDWQLLSSKNPAAAVGAGGYFLAVIISLGGPISWASASFHRALLKRWGSEFSPCCCSTPPCGPPIRPTLKA